MRKSTVGTRAALLPNPPAAGWLIGGFYNMRANAVGGAAKNFQLDSGVKWAQTSFRMNNKMGRLVQHAGYYWLFIRCLPTREHSYSIKKKLKIRYFTLTSLNSSQWKNISFFQWKGIILLILFVFAYLYNVMMIVRLEAIWVQFWNLICEN